MYTSCKLPCIFLLMFSFVVESQAQGVVDVQPQTSDRVSLGVFKNGWATIREGGNEYYIDDKGERIHIHGPNNTMHGTSYAIDEYEKERKDNPHLLPGNVVIFEKNGLQGVIDPKGEVLIPAGYDNINIQYRQFWELHKGGKISHYLPDGSTLPFFEDIGFLDGEHFDVKQGNGWHLYRKSSRRIITETAYEGFDYCGGCGGASPYVYAKKNGKWGIIDWEGNVLVPFEYDHEHRGMRSDNWVQSFSRNGDQVIVHIPTQQEFSANDSDTEIVSGMLITTKDGKYGAYNSDAELSVPLIYDNIEAPNQNYYLGYFGSYLIVEKDRLKGVVQSNGDLVLPVDYEEIMVYGDYFVATRDGKTSLLAVRNLQPLIQVEHGDIAHINDYFYSSGSGGLNIFRIKQKAYYGLYFADSGIFHEPEFYDISVSENDYFDDGRIVVADNQGQKTLLSMAGEPVLPFEVEDFEVFSRLEEPLLAIKVRGKWGLYDIGEKKEVVPPQYDRYFTVLEHSQSRFIRATIEREGERDRYVLYHSQGQKAIDADFSTIESIDGQHYLVSMGDAEKADYAIFNRETHMLEPLDYDFVSLSGSPRLLVVSDDRITGKLYAITAKETLQRNYRIFIFSGEVADGDASLETPGDMWSLSYFSNGLSRVDTKDGMGYIDENERVVIEPKYGRVQLVGDDYAIVNEIDDWQPAYFMDRSGHRIFPAAYYVDDIFFYNVDDYELDDVAILAKEEDDPTRYYGSTRYMGLGNLKTGEMLTEAVYSEIMVLYNFPYMILGQAVASESGTSRTTTKKYGVATKRGEILFEPKFDDIYYDDTSLPGDSGAAAVNDIFPLLVREGEKWRYIHADGSYLPVEGEYAHRY